LATDYTSAQAGAWGTAATWSPPGVPDSSADNVTVNHAVTVDGSYLVNNLTIAAGVLSCSADNTLWVYGDWTNNGRATLSNGSIEFVGTATGSIGGDSTTTFSKLVINKPALEDTVVLEHAARAVFPGLGSLNVAGGTLVTNGQDFDTDVENSVVTGGGTGKLAICGGGTVDMWMLQQDGLKYISVSDGATLNVSSWQFTQGTCLFEVLGGHVNYTQTNGWNFRIFGSSPPGFGYIVTGGTVTFYGDVVSSVWSYFDVSDSGVIRFAGNTNSTFYLQNAFGGVGWAHWRLNDLRIEKTGGATVLITAAGTTLMDSNVVVQKSLTVGPDANLVLSNPLFNGTFGFVIHDLFNEGALVDSDYTYITGNWNNSGTFRHGDNLVTFQGSENSLLAPGGDALFHDVKVAKAPQWLNVAGPLNVEHVLTVQDGTLGLSGETVTLGTDSTSGTVSVSGGTFSAVGSAPDPCRVMPASAAYPYRFAVASGGTLAARYAVFQSMDTMGVEVAGSIDATDNLSNCTFDHGTIGGRMLRIENSQVNDSILGTSFIGSAGYNVEKLNVSGHLRFDAGGGNRWGEDFENDPNRLIDWGQAGAAEERPSVTDEPSFSVGPTVAAGGFVRLNHNLPGTGRACVSLIDASGRSVLHSSFGLLTSDFGLDLRSTPPGVYLVRFVADGFSATRKLVLQ
jgi:hypothetical protein